MRGGRGGVITGLATGLASRYQICLGVAAACAHAPKMMMMMMMGAHGSWADMGSTISIFTHYLSILPQRDPTRDVEDLIWEVGPPRQLMTTSYRF